MAGDKEKIKSFGIALQPVPDVYVPITQADLLPIYSPDDGRDAITAEDDTLTGSIWNAPRQFLGARGRAGASARLRGPGAVIIPAANSLPIGRVMQAAGFSELRNGSTINGVTQVNADASKIRLAAAASAVDDFYKGFVIQCVNFGTGVRSNCVISSYNGTTKDATLCDTLGVAIGAGVNYTIPPQIAWVLSDGNTIPNLSCAVGHHRKTNRYKNCALNSFSITVPVANDTSQELPSIEFSMVGTSEGSVDATALVLPNSSLTPVPPAKAGRFCFHGKRLGHQSFRVDLGLEAGAPPNQNNDAGQEPYETLSGTRTINIDINQQLVADINIDGLVDNQTPVNVQSIWGMGIGNTWAVAAFNNYLDPLNPSGRGGFMGMSGNGAPSDLVKGVSVVLIF